MNSRTVYSQCLQTNMYFGIETLNSISYYDQNTHYGEMSFFNYNTNNPRHSQFLKVYFFFCLKIHRIQ